MSAFASKIKRRPEVEALLLIRDNRPDVMNKVLKLANARPS